MGAGDDWVAVKIWVWAACVDNVLDKLEHVRRGGDQALVSLSLCEWNGSAGESFSDVVHHFGLLITASSYNPIAVI